MALKFFVSSYCFAFSIFYQTELASTFQVVVDPPSFNEVVTNEMTISCVDNGSLPMVHTVVMMELWKNEKSPLVIARQGELISGPGIKLNMKASGQVDQYNASNSFVQLTITHPEKEDAGTYTCAMLYLKDLYLLEEVRASSNVTVNEFNITEVVAYLMGKVSILEKTNLQQAELIKRMDEKLAEHDKTFQRQMDKEKNTDSALAEIHNQLLLETEKNKVRDKTLMGHNSSITENEQRINDQGQTLQGYNSSITINKQRIRDQERQLALQEQYMTELGDNVTFTCAFSYRHNYNDTVLAGQILAFSKHIMNIGNDYNRRTGKFKAPRNGLYFFHIAYLIPNTNKDRMYVDLMARGVIVATSIAKADGTEDQTSISTVVSLNAGDEVWPSVRYHQNSRIEPGTWSVFTGYLIKVL